MNRKKIKKELSCYEFGQILGSGHYADVYEAISKKTGASCALKIYNKPDKGNYLEYGIVKNLDHPNIVSLKSHFETERYICFEFELCQKRTFEKAMKDITYPKLDSELTKKYMKQIFSALQYLSENGIVHRDVKPENILFKGDTLKLCDFNLACYQKDKIRSFSGTPYYIAPEIIRGGYANCISDVWAVGIILYKIVYGKYLSKTKSKHRYFDMVLYSIISFPDNSFPLEGRELLQKILEKDPGKRLTPGECLNHKFFEKF